MRPTRTPLLLLPGLLCDGALYQAQIAALADVAAPIVGDLTRHDSIPGIAAAMLGEMPEYFSLAGLSMGGYVAQEIMRQAPHRVIRLALLDTSARTDTDEQRTRRHALIDMAGIALLIHENHLTDQGLVDTVIGMADRVGHDGFVRQQTAIMGRPDGRADLQRIACPTLVLCGRHDALTPVALHEEMAAAIRGAKLVVVENCGHLSPLEQPDLVTAALRDWLAW